MKTKLIIASMVLLSGCSPSAINRSFTVGAVGCSYDQIEVSKPTYSFATGVSTWEARCAGVDYICSQTDSARNNPVTCTKKAIQNTVIISK